MSRSKIAIRLGNAIPGGIIARVAGNDGAKRLLRPVVTWIVPNEQLWVVVRSGAATGLEMLVDPKREKFYWTGAYEPTMQEAIRTTLCPGDAFWDIGAHAGFFTLIAARIVGTTGVVHAFEPSDLNRDRLVTNIVRNGFTNVTIHPEAVSDKTGSVEFITHSSSSMGRIGMASTEALAVPTTTIDRILEAAELTPRLIKVDAEGAELDILRGAHALLGNQMTAWLVEVHEPEDQQSILDVFESFHVQQLDRNHILARPKGSNMHPAGECR